MSDTPDPLAVSDPPVIDRPPLIVELAATVNPPPEMTSGSSAVMLFTDSTSELIVMVGVVPETLMATSSLGPGTFPVLQLLPTSQDPLVAEIQLTVASSCRRSNGSIHGIAFRLRGRERRKRERTRKIDRGNRTFMSRRFPGGLCRGGQETAQRCDSDKASCTFRLAHGSSEAPRDVALRLNRKALQETNRPGEKKSWACWATVRTHAGKQEVPLPSLYENQDLC